jgi:cytochrome P450
MYFGAANRDPELFEDPESLDLSRRVNPHIAFGGGPHACLGQHLARVEIDAMLREVLGRMRELEVVDDPRWHVSNFISGPQSLAVRFRPASAD